QGRLEKTVALRAERQRRGSECLLLDCLQIKDKADILLSDSASLAALGLHSRREADRLTRDIEKLRNHLAHAQELETEHLSTAAWRDGETRAASTPAALRISRRLFSPDRSSRPICSTSASPNRRARRCAGSDTTLTKLSRRRRSPASATVGSGGWRRVTWIRS